MTTNVTAFEDRLASDDRWFVRVNEGARLVGVSPKAIYAGIYAGSLPVWRFGKSGKAIVIPEAAVQAWLASKEADGGKIAA